MRKVAVEEAVGMTLCHDITKMIDGFKGAAFHRGHVIREEDIPELLNIGKKHIFVWEPEADEIHEEDCALRLAALCEVPGAHYTEPSEGKILLKADVDGMFRVNVPLQRAINHVEDFTICSLPDHYPVKAGARLASMRIVPLVTQERNMEEVERLNEEAEEPLYELVPYEARNCGVIITGSEIYSGRIRDKFEPVVRRKLEAYPGKIVGVTVCDDDLEMIVDAARTHLENGADFLIFTGGMSVDPDDLTPTAIRELGAKLVTYGVPSQPGNMTLVAYLEQPGKSPVPVLGVPGAAISLPTTMFDVLLPQIYSGRIFTKEELLKLGDGGLCQMCASCHWPNCTFGRY